MLVTTLKGISRRFAPAILPSQCAVCHRWPCTSRICTDCISRFWIQRTRCRTCAMPVSPGMVQCGECLLHASALHHCVAALDYVFPWSLLITQFKFQPDPGWATTLSALLQKAAGAHALLREADWVLPIPLSRERLAERGFNQSLLLARHCGAAKRKIHNGILLRIQHTPAQSGLSRAQRLRNLRQSFAIEPLQQPLVQGRSILLIDDVMTTGATLQTAAQCLLQAGAREVGALVLARTE